MPGQAPVVGDERDALRVFLEYHQSSYLAVAFGLSDEQARSKPTVSALSIGGLIKHATGVQRSWMEQGVRNARRKSTDNDKMARKFRAEATEKQDRKSVV